MVEVTLLVAVIGGGGCRARWVCRARGWSRTRSLTRCSDTDASLVRPESLTCRGLLRREIHRAVLTIEVLAALSVVDLAPTVAVIGTRGGS